jgi:hypothetical protein
VRQLLAGLFRDLVKISFSKNKTQKTKYKEQGTGRKIQNPGNKVQGTSYKAQDAREENQNPKNKIVYYNSAVVVVHKVNRRFVGLFA